MNFVNVKSKVAHYPDCRFVRRITEDNLRCYESTFYAKKDGYRLCKCCDPMAKRLGNRETEMLGYCRKRAISYEVDNGELLITTPFSEWKAYPGKNSRYVLYHRNTQGDTSGYHLQTDRYKDVMELLKYIDRHDNFRLDNPLPEPKKKKAPPKKGTKRYRAAERRRKERKRRKDIRNVLNLIDSLALV